MSEPTFQDHSDVINEGCSNVFLNSEFLLHPSSPRKTVVGFAVSNPDTHPNAGDIMTAKVLTNTTYFDDN